MQDRIQLKREEIVDDGVALSDINPVTNTKSVDDSSSGEPLSVTIEKMWQAINNSLSRIVNSVNNRDGVVVITAEDVGLGNVTNVSFSTIKDWVIDEMIREFNLKRFMIFDTMAEMTVEMENWAHDDGHADIPFYIKEYSTENKKSYIGYTYWDTTNLEIALRMVPINVIGYTDNSIIYDESINGHDLTGGGIAVNIKKGEDALKVDNDTSKGNGGLYIDKSKIAPNIYYFDGVYGSMGNPLDMDGLIYVSDGTIPPDAHPIEIHLNGNVLASAYTFRTFKAGDIIVTNFSDANYRDAGNGRALKRYLDEKLVCREASIGSVTAVYDELVANSKYVIDLYSVKPYVGNGLKYHNVHTALGDVTSSMIGVDIIEGKISDIASNDNFSGLNAFTDANTSDPTLASPKQHYTVSPIGEINNELIETNGLFIAPDFSLNVIPYNSFNANNVNNPITNWPTVVPSLSDLTKEAFLGVNLLKKYSITGMNAGNMSGLRILNSSDTITNALLGKSNNDTSDKLDADIDGSGDVKSSGGLAVNVGRFLEIGTYVGSDASPRTRSNYYDGGKINVRVDDLYFSDTDNRLSLKLSKFASYTNKDTENRLGGGLTYTLGSDTVSGPLITPGLTINRGLGLRMSHYNKQGETPSEVDDKAYLAVSVADQQFTSDDIGYDGTMDNIIGSYGGLRYMIGDGRTGFNSFVGLRVNNSTSTIGHQLRLGEKAVGIDENNVVQVQRYRETDAEDKDTNPLVIKGWDEEAIYPYVKIKGLRDGGTVDGIIDLPSTPTSSQKKLVYFVNEENRRYVWSDDSHEFVPMFVYNDTPPGTGEWNRVYVETEIDNANHTYIGKALEWIPEHITHVPFTWNSATQQYDDTGYNVPNMDSILASKILKYYSLGSTRDEEFDGYYDAAHDIFYRHMYSDPFVPTKEWDGKILFDMTNGEPAVPYECQITSTGPNPEDFTYHYAPAITYESHDATTQDLAACDFNNDGLIDAIDATIVLNFYAHTSVGEYSDVPPVEAMKQYLHDYYHLDDVSPAQYEIIHQTDPNGSFMPGLDINLNNAQGITSEIQGDIKNHVSVKIYDRSAWGDKKITDPEGKTHDQQYQGGLRFTTDGFLAVRVNDMHMYDATDPTGRQGVDWCRRSEDGGGRTLTTTRYGARGLQVYPNNVLGIQLDDINSLDNGELCIDEGGNLRISPNYHGGGGGGENLTITDGTNTVQYNGSTATTLTLGPGLILVPDPPENNG